jgi:hypothetical protein
MKNDQTENEKNLPTVVNGDGFEDHDGDSRLIQGAIIRCVDGHWSSKDGTVLTADMRLVALGTATALQRWKNNKPAEPAILKMPGKPLPHVEELNRRIPEAEWEMGLGGVKRPPWVKQHIVYLLNPQDASVFTFINSTSGAAIAVRKLKDRVKMMRVLRGNRVVPIVKLASAPMPTQFGMKVRPEFTILEWRDLSGGNAQVAHVGPPSPLAIEHVGKEVEPVTLAEELNDSVGF